MVMMEGILYKWTNYLSGWQPRWFVLDYGVLAYYRSQDEMNLGSRGSVKLSCCEILINNADPVRIDLKIPPENYMYLKASTAAERQKWLVALGTAKACLVDSNAEEQQQKMNSMVYLKDKMKELDLCRGIMLEQIHQIKLIAVNADEHKPVIESVTLLSATCDTFATNLNEIMEIIEDNLSTMSGSPVSTPRLQKPPTHHHSHRHKKNQSPPSTPSSHTGSMSDTQDKQKGLLHSSSSEYSNSKNSDRALLSPGTPNQNQQQIFELHGVSPDAYKVRNLPLQEIINDQMHGPMSPTIDSSVSSVSSLLSSSDGGNVPVPPLILEDELPRGTPKSPEKVEFVGKSFFGKAPARFEDVQLNSDGLIPTSSFLAACSSIVPVFDSLGSTTFAPVKMDIQGNIQKIKLKYETDVMAFEFLQNIVFQELKSNEHNAKNSATDALLWLKRALEFILVFLSEVSKGQRDLANAAGIAYERSLKKYHGWIVRGVFALAVKSCPYYKDFIKALSTTGTGVAASEGEALAEMASCVEALNRIVSKLNSYYRKNKLDSDAVV
ncbi:pleckstrin homology domain-containing family A member 8-like isoform X1 [Hydractinia symbiolongicarpus]|uniref:pleckstrin homology domain-containing family A member 8-like isoform X1 n=2 Tax=Hydractinia symbiolongicarpus TaxID=13093 RepID=UPI0025513C19|nr:pleckstrin homology domain-containing family A member 8-like isoform X1 [Hydractinia symbiolongicarpus]